MFLVIFLAGLLLQSSYLALARFVLCGAYGSKRARGLLNEFLKICGYFAATA
jgi:hypothetical protein